ncbi:MAG TPA: response regulator transcription factor [Bacteroidia bacterium]|nr:response regulator transcription factor [Bacteroidia bacterium]
MADYPDICCLFMKTQKIKLTLIEDHAEFRESLHYLLNSDEKYDCVSFPNAEEALKSFRLRVPEIVVMDINLPGISGIDCTRAIREKYPGVQVMMCTVYEDDEKIFEALKAGANGYLLKRAAINEIFESIHSIYTGGSPMSPVIARKVVASLQTKKTAAPNKLSTRENEILDLIAEGCRIKEIAERLFISVNTVRTHIRHIYEKLQVQSRIEALNKTGKNRF